MHVFINSWLLTVLYKKSSQLNAFNVNLSPTHSVIWIDIVSSLDVSMAIVLPDLVVGSDLQQHSSI